MDELELLKKRLERERNARKEAERILEFKARQLFDANASLIELNQNLEQEIAKRTASLKESELRYRILVEQAQDLIYNVDEHGYFTYVNSIGISKFGYSEKHILGSRYVDYIPVEDVEREFEYYSSMRDSGIKNDYHEFRVKSKDGEIFWLGQNVIKVDQEDGKFYYSVVARDITKRKDAEKKLDEAKLSLQKSEIKYRSIIENMDLGLMEVDTNGVILRVYDKFNKMLGYQNDELIGKSANKILLVDGYEKVMTEQDNNRAKGEPGIYEVKVKKKDGTEIWVLISGAPFYDVNGRIAGSIGVHYDITDRKILEEQLEIARLKAVKAQQAEKAFLANMSHEIRTPLNVIIGMSHLLTDTNLNDEQQDYLEALSSSANMLKSLISDILDISKIDAGTLDVQEKPFNVYNLVEQLTTSFSIQKDKSEVIFDHMVDPNIDYLVCSDTQLLNQILLNLLSNAQKFTEKGKILISVNIIEESKNEALLKFQVSDTGIGISSDELKVIFGEFKQANAEVRRKYGGTGLGLTISYHLTKLLGGELKAESVIGQGSTFYFTLKLKKAEGEIDKLTHKEKFSSLKFSNSKILIVEDNTMNLKYITALLKKWNLQFEVCRNGKEACERTNDEHFDLIFMDLQMPVMDGFEATQIIRSTENQNRNTPIIALTASTFLSKKRLALKAGMSDFLSKPFTPSQLFDIISKYLNHPSEKVIHTECFEFNTDLDIEYLKEAYGSDINYAKEMFETFLEIVDEELMMLRDSIENGTSESIKLKLHKIKPTFTMVGLRKISNTIENIELKINQLEGDELILWYQSVEKKIKHYIPILEHEVIKFTKWLNN